MMSEHSNKTEKEEFIEILDDGYVVRKGSTEVYRCIQSRNTLRCPRSESRKHSLRMRLKSRRLRKKMRKKKIEWEMKDKGPDIEVTSVQNPPHLSVPQQPQQSIYSSSTSVPFINSSKIIDLSIEGEPASLPEPVSIADPLPMPTEFEAPPSLNEAIESSDASRIEPEVENDTVEWLDEADTENGDTIDVVRKLLWHINSAYHCRGVLGKEHVGESPNVRLEPEPTNLSDPNAIKLMFQAKNGEWVHGGYVPKVETQKVRNLGGRIIGARVAFWRNRGSWRAPYVQLLYRDRIKRVAVTNQTLLTPSIITEKYWIAVHSRKHKTHPSRVLYGKWLLFIDKKRLDSVWHRVAYKVQNGYSGKGCTIAKCSTARESQYCSDSNKGVICVYTTRSTINHVGFKLSKLTRIPKIHYKTNAATKAGIFAGDPGCTFRTIKYNKGISRLSNTKQN